MATREQIEKELAENNAEIDKIQAQVKKLQEGLQQLSVVMYQRAGAKIMLEKLLKDADAVAGPSLVKETTNEPKPE